MIIIYHLSLLYCIELLVNLTEITCVANNLHCYSFRFLSTQLKCCGVTSYKEWKNSTWAKNMTAGYKFPDSCCQEMKKDCGKDADAKHWTKVRYDQHTVKPL